MTVLNPTKDLPLHYNLKDWRWGVFEPCADYFAIADLMFVDPTSPTGLRYRDKNRSKRFHWQPAGSLNVCRAGTLTGSGRTRSKDYSRICVTVPKCTDAWASRRAKRTKGSPRTYAHNVIWLLTTGNWPPPHLVIDHIDVDATNNLIENLRLFTTQLNNGNRVKVLKRLDMISGPSLDR